MDRRIDPLEPDHPFYRVTAEDLDGEQGRLIRHEQLTGYVALDAAAATYRVMYESVGTIPGRADQPIGVSGLVAFPTLDPPAAGWPVVSWAHGTVGSADKCAPSMDSDDLGPPGDSGLGLLRTINKAPHKLLNAFLDAGWAVAMTDYEGLGTYGNHPYLLGRSEARGILDIVPAARQLAATTVRKPVSDRYVIVGHSQGGQAALFGAHYAASYGTAAGMLAGVAALAPASNLTGERIPVLGGGLWSTYQLNGPVGELGGFFPLFCNGVFAARPDIDKHHIFQDEALEKYLEHHDSKARVELSADPAWANKAPVALINKANGIFRPQSEYPDAWEAYWAQVDDFNPDKKIAVPIRISQAELDTRVQASKTRQLLDQLGTIPGQGPITDDFYDTVDPANPNGLGAHFGLLLDNREIAELVDWAGEL